MFSSGKNRRPDSRGAGGARGDNGKIRFEMEPENLGLSDRELMGDLRRVARRLKTDAMTMESYNRFGRVAAGTICKRFGGWNLALAAAGLSPVKRSRVTAEEVVENFEARGPAVEIGEFFADAICDPRAVWSNHRLPIVWHLDQSTTLRRAGRLSHQFDHYHN